MKMRLYLILLFSSMGAHFEGAETNLACPSKVFLQYTSYFLIDCTFRPNFESVFWYQIPDQGPFISYQQGLKSGVGYDSGEFDIASDGSLIILNVSLNLDGQLRVFVHYQQWENDVRQIVDLTVYVQAHQKFPDINVCKRKRYCHTILRGNELLVCSVNETRPAAKLSWFEKYGNTNVALPSEKISKNVEHTISVVASTSVTMVKSQLLEVVLCRSSNVAPILMQNYSMILIEKNLDDYSSKSPITLLSKVNNNLYLGFDNENVYAAVWKKRLPTGIYQTIGYFFYGVSDSYDVTFEINNKGLLGIKRFQLENEGEYLAVFATPTSHTYKIFQVHAYIAPTPPFPKIFGCVDKQSCTINVGTNGRLTCSLEGIRPLVHLEWVFVGRGVSPIAFSSPLLSVANRGFTYDSLVTTSFSMKPETHQSNIEVACRVADQIEGLPAMVSNISLHYASESNNSTTYENCEELYRRGGIFLKIGISLTSLAITAFCCVSFCGKN
ncbi:hypothetical protein HOLleu_01412 [Holothuria leucospilota]|uniref:Ig-like domain-containing protein n=1 Tax=Holothuria leucospilota TaxID=206669 RepID=A0A9Q1CQA3_HOLLE|nr:hypothetical protein HOLleu_01412 [Holothuria leucospilota]